MFFDLHSKTKVGISIDSAALSVFQFSYRKYPHIIPTFSTKIVTSKLGVRIICGYICIYIVCWKIPQLWFKSWGVRYMWVRILRGCLRYILQKQNFSCCAYLNYMHMKVCIVESDSQKQPRWFQFHKRYRWLPLYSKMLNSKSLANSSPPSAMLIYWVNSKFGKSNKNLETWYDPSSTQNT